MQWTGGGHTDHTNWPATFLVSQYQHSTTYLHICINRFIFPKRSIKKVASWESCVVFMLADMRTLVHVHTRCCAHSTSSSLENDMSIVMLSWNSAVFSPHCFVMGKFAHPSKEHMSNRDILKGPHRVKIKLNAQQRRSRLHLHTDLLPAIDPHTKEVNSMTSLEAKANIQ